MRKYRMKMSNSCDKANWNKIILSHEPNRTNNSVITTAIFNRECIEYDAGVLPHEHEKYLGDRCE